LTLKNQRRFRMEQIDIKFVEKERPGLFIYCYDLGFLTVLFRSTGYTITIEENFIIIKTQYENETVFEGSISELFEKLKASKEV